MARAPAFLSRAYRIALHLYPARFRAEFGAELEQDFEDAAGEAWQSSRRRDPLLFVARIGRDLAKTVVVQWARTGFPVLVCISMSVAAIAATAAVKITTAPAWTPAVRPEDEEFVTLMLLIGTVLFLIVATIVFTLSFLRPKRSRKRT